VAAALIDVTVAVLDALERFRAPYALAGGLAANLWVAGEHQQATFDADAAVASGVDPDALVRHLEAALERFGGFHSATLPFRKARIERLLCPPEIPVDLILLKDTAYSALALERAATTELRGKRYPVLRPEDVILHKSLGRREKDVAALSFLAGDNALDLEYVETWARRLGTWTFVRRALPRR